MSNFHHLTRGIVISDNMVLLAHAMGHRNTFLPGGHIEFGESAPNALKREIEEEIGLSCSVGSFLGLVEHKWEKNKELHCEINQAFKVKIPELEAPKSPTSREAHIEFFWVPVNELDKYGLQPYPFRKLIQQLVKGDDSVWWGSTLESENDSDNIG